jgi:hypothetical protein
MTWNRGTLANFMGDNLVYRNLEPMNPGIPGLSRSWNLFGMDHYFVPRKTEPLYAQALAGYLKQAQKLRGQPPLERILFVGDTLMLDGTAARNLGAYYPMLGFIGAERSGESPKLDIQGDLMVANRWGALAEWLAWVRDQGWTIDERTALLLDLDKTCLGARGRNDKVIDRARVKAVEATLASALGEAYDAAAFRAVYDPLNQPAYHPFTGDNQDYLAYICLMVAAGVHSPERLWAALERQEWRTINDFVAASDAERSRMSEPVRAAHDEVLNGITREDPTPFKAFRRREYLETVGLMDVLGDDAAPEDVLAAEIVITAEVASLAKSLAAQGVLVFGLSDKPDEASTPTDEHAAIGLCPLHHTTMKIYGQELF